MTSTEKIKRGMPGLSAIMSASRLYPVIPVPELRYVDYNNLRAIR